ncbi:hypothetical protein [Teredinibacter purpureus]|uniref:hypothetical protein n=1 Tax=Teredinibacter purpureus TaxID=2731756 RepID=UPI0006987EBC|nr:hypothetical protein [Teredinibacter purpureus]
MKLPLIIRTCAIAGLALLTACGGGGSGGSSNGGISSRIGLVDDNNTDNSNTDAPSDTLDDVAAWRSDAPYANVLYRCALAQVENTNAACDLDTLPLLGMEVDSPTVDDIMGRVLVSHDWMAERFEQALNAYPDEMLTLFRGLTAIVIDDDIRPAFYSSNTGAIYLDPFYLWTTNAEKTTINTKEDYRAGFSDPLSFRAWSRYTRFGTYAFTYGSLDDQESRSISSVILISARLLLHELAHVNDFLPYDSYGSINLNNTVDEAIANLANGRLSDRLSNTDPLTSDILHGLGRVMYRGTTPSSTQRQYSAEFVGEEYENDAAADAYAYSSQFEDVAMLFEVAMMKYFWDIDYQVAFVTPVETETYCDEYLIGWSALNWIGNTDVKSRAMLVTNELLPTIDMTLFYQELEAPIVTNEGNWCFNSTASSGLAKLNDVIRTPINPADFERYEHRH